MQYSRKPPKRKWPKAKSGDSLLQEDKYPKIDYPPKATSQRVPPQHTVNDPSKSQTQEENKTRTEQKIDRIKKTPVVIIVSILLGLLTITATALGNISTIETNWHTLFPSPVSNSCTNAPESVPLGFTFCTYRGHKGPVFSVAWSPDGKRIASAGADGTVQVRDATTGSNVIIYRGHKGPVTAVAWSPYGQRIASGGVDGNVQVWDSDTGSPVYSYSSIGKVSALVWSPDGQWIAYGTEKGNVEIFDALKGDIESISYSLRQINKYGSVRDLSWSPDSKLIAVSYSGDDPSPGHVEIWTQNLSTRIITYNIPSYNLYVGPTVWSPDGKFIAFASYPTAGFGSSLGVRNVSQGNFSYDFGFNPGIESLAWSCDSKYIALGSIVQGLVYLWDVEAGKRIFIYQAETSSVDAVAWSPDGTLIASADDAGTIRVWKASNKKLC